MNTWWENLNLRERYIVVFAGLIALIIGFDALVIEQYRAESQILNDKLEQAEQDLMWMKEAVFRLPPLGQKNQKVDTGRVVTYVDKQITRLKLKKHMQQMTPIGADSVRLRLTDLDFAKLMTLFRAIDNALVIKEVRLTAADSDGLINVSVVVSKGSTAT